MSEVTQLDAGLAPFRRRLRLLLAERAALLGGAAGAGVALALVALNAFRLVRADWRLAVALVAAGLLVGWLWGARRRLPLFEVARAAEARLALQERVSSAVALEPVAGEQEMVQALVADAAARIGAARPAALFPRRFGRQAKLFLVAVGVTLAAMVLPELPLFQSQATRRERTVMRREGEKLVKLAERLEKTPLEARQAQILRQLAANLKALGKDMRDLRLTRKQALIRMDKLEQQAREAEQRLLSERSQKSLAQAAAELKQGRESELPASLKAEIERQAAAGKPLTKEQAEAMERLAKSLPPSAATKLLKLDQDLASLLAELLAKKDMQAALEILADLARKLEEPGALEQLSPEELKRLEEELRRLAEALKGTDLDQLAKDLLEMAKALQRGDLKACRGKSAKLGKGCLGLAAGLSACNAAIAGLRSGRGKGVGPGDGLAKYDANARHDVNRGEERRIPTQHYDTRIPGQIGKEGEAYSIQVMGAPDQPAKGKVPYYEVYSDYRKVAESALQREEVPPAYRDRVKTYFESLQPEK